MNKTKINGVEYDTDMYNRVFEHEGLVVEYELEFNPNRGVIASITQFWNADDGTLSTLSQIKSLKEINLKLEEKEAMINLYEYKNFEEDYSNAIGESEWERSDDR